MARDRQHKPETDAGSGVRRKERDLGSSAPRMMAGTSTMGQVTQGKSRLERSTGNKRLEQAENVPKCLVFVLDL